jgi:MtrB/PioB family decaheme-associated outer membrane protein
MKMKISTHLLLLLTLSAPAAVATAADNATAGGADSVDTSQWKCKYCAFEEGSSGTVEAGLGYVSKDSFKFGEYTGLNQQGGFFVGNASVRFRGEDAAYWNIDASDLGLDSRSLNAEGGRQGTYKVYFKYKELPHFISDSVQTPFLGVGSDSLTLPSGWVQAASTTGMTALPGSLHRADLDTKRQRVSVGAALIPAPEWQYGINVRHETKEGMQRIAGTFLFSTAQLVEPVDYVTDQVEVFASYTGTKWQSRFSYYGSLFRDGNSSLTWQNPYTPVSGASAGQLALPPDNQFHQVLASVGYQFSERTRATADLAFGRMTQDENFLAPTLNTTLAVPALPRNSLDGKVNTVNANLKLSSAVTDKLRLNAAYIYNDRDNKTPPADFPWVSTDRTVNAARTYLPYSFTQETLKLSADYRILKSIRTSVGFDNDSHKRTFQESEKTRENTFWGKVSAQARDNVDVSLKLTHGERDHSGYAPVSGITVTENPLLMKYYMANRTRNGAGLRVDVAAGEAVNFGFGADVARDQYTDSAIGLTESKDFSLNGDASVLLTKKTSLHFFLNHEEIHSQQAGSQAFSTPDWTGENDDTIDVAGFGVKRVVLTKKLDVGADYTLTQTHGAVTVDAGTPSAPFPDLQSRLDTLKFYATYHLKDNISLQGAYWYERYHSENWALDGVAPSTISNVLAFGEQPPSYHVNVITLALRYRF